MKIQFCIKAFPILFKNKSLPQPPKLFLNVEFVITKLILLSGLLEVRDIDPYSRLNYY